MLRIGSFQGMKNLNKSALLNLIRLYGPISRAELAKRTTLTPPTVTNIVGELLSDGLVIEREAGSSTGGRRPILLEIHKKGWGGIALYAGGQEIRGMLATLDGVPVEEARIGVSDGISKADYLRSLAEVTDQLMESRGNLPLLGIGVGMHGLVDPVKGASLFAPHLHLANLPIKRHLEERFGLEVEVENDVRVMALAEQWFGEGIGRSNVVVLHVGNGIGAGIIIGGKLYRGTGFAAGEVGHTVVLPDGPLCSCGQRGCLEALSSGIAIAQRYREMKQAPSTEALTGEQVILRAKEGDETAKAVVQEAGRYLGYAIVNLIHTLNPERIILIGSVLEAGDLFIYPMKRVMDDRTLPIARGNVEIHISQLGEKSSILGAFTLLLEKFFNRP